MDYWALVLVPMTFVLGLLYYWRYRIRVVRYKVHVSGLPENFDGFTILQLSDLHSKSFGPRQRRLVRVIKNQRYDLAALTGDFVNKFKPDAQPFFNLAAHLTDKQVMFVPGNHEWRTGFQYRNEVQSMGIQLLENDAVKIKIGEQSIWILGVDDPHLGRDSLAKALRKASEDAPKVLLAHSPTVFPEAVRAGIDLVLAGHTHGGQVRFPWLGALMVPGQGLFPKWDYGLYRSEKSTLVVSGGLGESDLPVRINIWPEVVIVELTR